MPFSRLFIAFAFPATRGLSLAADDRAGVAFFEANIRPLLVERCNECHSSEKGQSKGGLTLGTQGGVDDGRGFGCGVRAGEAGGIAAHQGGAAIAVQDVTKPRDSRVFIRGDEPKPGPSRRGSSSECSAPVNASLSAMAAVGLS